MTWRGFGARSIRHKLIGIVLATTFVALSLAGVALVIFDLKSYESSMSADLLTQARLSATKVVASTMPISLCRIERAPNPRQLISPSPRRRGRR